MHFQYMNQAQKRLAEIRERIQEIHSQGLTDETKKEIKYLRSEYINVSNQLPSLYVHSLKSTEEIYTDACELTAEAIRYIYWKFADQLERGIIPAPVDGIKIISFTHSKINRFDPAYKARLALASEKEISPDSIGVYLESNSVERFIRDTLLVDHLEALKGNTTRKRLSMFISQFVKECPLIRKKANNEQITSLSLFSASNSLPVYHSQFLDNIAKLNASDFENITGGNTYQYDGDNDFTMIISDISGLKLNMSVRCHQLFNTALSIFTENNMKLSADKPLHDYTVTIPIDQYIELLGYDIREKPQPTPELQAEERKRVSDTRNFARKKIKKDLDTLHHSTIKIRTKKDGYFRFSICQVTGITRQYIYIKFGNDIIRYLATLPKTQYPLWLLGISGRHPNAYRIGYKLSTYSSIDRNRRTGQADRIKVKNLLNETDLPTMKDLENAMHGDGKREQKRNAARKWRERIKQPLEAALDYLVEKDDGGLLSWHYARPGSAGKEINRDVAGEADYERFADLLVVFEMVSIQPSFSRRKEVRQVPCGDSKI